MQCIRAEHRTATLKSILIPKRLWDIWIVNESRIDTNKYAVKWKTTKTDSLRCSSQLSYSCLCSENVVFFSCNFFFHCIQRTVCKILVLINFFICFTFAIESSLWFFLDSFTFKVVTHNWDQKKELFFM